MLHVLILLLLVLSRWCVLLAAIAFRPLVGPRPRAVHSPNTVARSVSNTANTILGPVTAEPLPATHTPTQSPSAQSINSRNSAGVTPSDSVSLAGPSGPSPNGSGPHQLAAARVAQSESPDRVHANGVNGADADMHAQLSSSADSQQRPQLEGAESGRRRGVVPSTDTDGTVAAADPATGGDDSAYHTQPTVSDQQQGSHSTSEVRRRLDREYHEPSGASAAPAASATPSSANRAGARTPVRRDIDAASVKSLGTVSETHHLHTIVYMTPLLI